MSIHYPVHIFKLAASSTPPIPDRSSPNFPYLARLSLSLSLSFVITSTTSKSGSRFRPCSRNFRVLLSLPVGDKFVAREIIPRLSPLRSPAAATTCPAPARTTDRGGRWFGVHENNAASRGNACVTRPPVIEFAYESNVSRINRSPYAVTSCPLLGGFSPWPRSYYKDNRKPVIDCR